MYGKEGAKVIRFLDTGIYTLFCVLNHNTHDQRLTGINNLNRQKDRRIEKKLSEY